jgi:hypothetical protein
MVPTDQLATFERTLRAGHYSLLFGAEVSTDSSNVLGQTIQGAEQFQYFQVCHSAKGNTQPRRHR